MAVGEVGASPLEPYHGPVAIEAIEPSVALSVLCACDPYALVGAMAAYGRGADLVTGPATNTGRRASPSSCS